MATQGAEVLTKFTADTKDADKKTDDLSKKIGKFAKGMGTAFVGAVGVASVAVVGLLKTSVDAFGEMEQLTGGAKKIFDEMDYSKIENDAKNAYKTMNMSAKEYIEAMNTVGATFSQTMGDEKGYNTAKQGLQAIADYASGTGASVTVLTDKFKAITRSTTSYLSIADQFAGLLPQTTDGFLKQAQASGYLSKQYKKLNDVPVAEYQEAVSKMLEKGVKDMGLYGNTLAETTETLTGSLAAARGAWDNFISGIGSIDDVVDSFLIALKQIGKVVRQMLPIVTKGLVELINGLIPEIPGLVKELLPPILEGAISIVRGVIDMLPEFIDMLATMLPDIIEALIDGFVLIVEALAEQAPILIPKIITAIINGLLKLTEPKNMNKLNGCGVDLMNGFLDGFSNVSPELQRRLPEIIKAIVTGLYKEAGKLFTAGFDIGGKLGEKMANGIKKKLKINSPSKVFEVIGQYTVDGYIEGLDDMTSSVEKQMAKTLMPTITPDLNPIADSTLGSMLANTPTSNITIHNSMEFDALGQLVNNVKTFSGGAKNDYNYVGGY